MGNKYEKDYEYNTRSYIRRDSVGVACKCIRSFGTGVE